MAFLDTSRSTTPCTPRSAVAQFFAAMFNAITSWNDTRITRKVLSQLSMRELNDIGLAPGDIDRISRR
jgi:uncharacterized protein YjiS (DUF1127 family)